MTVTVIFIKKRLDFCLSPRCNLLWQIIIFQKKPKMIRDDDFHDFTMFQVLLTAFEEVSVKCFNVTDFSVEHHLFSPVSCGF